MSDEAWQQFMAGHLGEDDRRNWGRAFLAGLREERAAISEQIQVATARLKAEVRQALRE